MTLTDHANPRLAIGTCAALRGQRTEGLLPAGVLEGGRALYLPVQMITGSLPGPVLFLSATIHGDEVSGIETMRRFLAAIHPGQLAGTIIALPVMNPPGYHANQRTVPPEDLDLNRVFPGRQDGALAEQIAWHVFEHVLRQVDYGVDLHDAGKTNVLLPHCRIPADSDARMRGLGIQFGTELIMERTGSAGMLAIECQRLLKLPMLTVELGGGQRLHEPYIRQGVNGLTNFAAALGMIPAAPALPEFQFVMKEQTGIPAPFSGLIQFTAEVGAVVQRDMPLATLTDPLTDRVESIRAPQTGVLFSRKVTARVDEGESLGSVLAFGPEAIHGVGPIEGELLDQRNHGGALLPAPMMEALRRHLAPHRQPLAAE